MDEQMALMLKEAEQGKMRAGKQQLIAHLKGKRLYRSQAIAAKCYDCSGMGESNECDMRHCSLHPYSPYGKRWVSNNKSRSGAPAHARAHRIAKKGGDGNDKTGAKRKQPRSASDVRKVPRAKKAVRNRG